MHLYHTKGALFEAFIKKVVTKKDKGKILLALCFKLSMLMTLLASFNVSILGFLSAEFITYVNIHFIYTEIINIPI